MSEQDIRWKQRFANYNRAIAKLQEVIDSLDSEQGNINNVDFLLSELEIEGTIQRFEYTHELAWNVMKDYLIYQGILEVTGSRDATREAFKIDLISNAEGWMSMIKSRNQTSHTYDEDTAKEIFLTIINEYYPLFKDFQCKMKEFLSAKDEDVFSGEL